MAGTPIVGRVAVKVIPDTDGFRKDTQDGLKRQTKGLKVKVDVEPVLTKAALKRTEQQLKKWVRDISPLQVKLKVDLDKSSTAVANAEVAGISKNRTIGLKLELDNASVVKVGTALAALSGARAVAGVFEKVREEILNLDKAVPTISALTLAVSGLGTAALASVGNVASLATSVATMAQAGLALPGLLGGVVIGLGATVAALADFNTYVPQAAGYMKQLQDTISGNFWAVAAGSINALVDQTFPALNSMLATTSTALGGFFSSLATSLSGTLVPNLAPMFENLNASITEFTSHTDAIANIVSILGSLGASYLPALATWFGTLTERLNDFLTTANDSGKLTGWVDQGIIAVQDFASVLGSLGRILGSVASASQAAGGTTLATLADGLAKVADIAEKPAFKLGITATLSAAYDAINTIGTMAGPALANLASTMFGLGGTFSKVAPMIGQTIGVLGKAIAEALASPAVQNGIVALISGIQQLGNSLAPVMGMLGEKLGMVMQVVGALATNIGLILGPAITALMPIFEALFTGIMPIINMLGPFLGDLITKLQPVFVALGEGVKQVLAALQPLLQKVMELINLLLPVLVPVLEFLVKVLVDSLVGAINGITKIIGGVIDVIKGVIDFVVGVFTGDWDRAWSGVQQIFAGIWDIIVGLFQVVLNVGILGFAKKIFFSVKTFFKTTWDDIAKTFTGAITGIKNKFTTWGNDFKTVVSELWSSIKSRASTLWAEIKAIPSNALTAVKNFFTGVKGDIEAAWGLLWGGLKGIVGKKIDDAVARIKGIKDTVTGFFSGATSWLRSSGESIIQGLVDGIKAMAGKVSEAVQGVLEKARNLLPFSPAKEGPFSGKGWTLYSGESISEALADGIRSRASQVRSAMNSVVSTASDTLGIDVNAPSTSNLRRAASAAGASAAPAEAPVYIDSITIPLADLEQLKTLDDFINMLRVNTRKG